MNKERNNHAFPLARADAKNQMLFHRQLRPLRASLLYILFLFPALHLPMPVLGQSIYSTPYTFTTLAGQMGTSGTNDGMGSAARFGYPGGVIVGNDGNIYMADIANHTAFGKVTTWPGED